MKAPMIAAIFLAFLVQSARADDAASVLVQTVAPMRGQQPDLLATYGTAGPALDGGMTLSLQQDGRVTAISVTPGEAVHTGQKLIEFGASANVSSTYAQAVSALALARSQRAHAAQLLGQQLATRDQVAQADKAVSDAQATLDALRREGAANALQTLTAPFDGIVATIPVAQGDRLQPGVPLLTLTRLDGLVVTVGIDPADRRRVRPGQPAQLGRLSGGATLEGQVLRIDGVLNPKTRMVDADVSVPKGTVLSGEAFRVAITTGQLQGWLVPHDAVLTDQKGAYVFQVAAAKAARVDVKLVGIAGNTDVIDGPLDPARKLVVQGNYQLNDGMAVREEAAP